MNPRQRSPLRPAWPLVACLFVALIWPASQLWTGQAAGGAGDYRLAIEVGPGWLGLTAWRVRRATRAAAGSRTGEPPANRVRRLTGADRAALAFPRVYPVPGEYRFYTPTWMVALSATLFATAVVASRWRRAHSVRPGRCRRCGYDLRATPDLCPECGARPGEGVLA